MKAKELLLYVIAALLLFGSGYVVGMNRQHPVAMFNYNSTGMNGHILSPGATFHDARR